MKKKAITIGSKTGLGYLLGMILLLTLSACGSSSGSSSGDTAADGIGGGGGGGGGGGLLPVTSALITWNGSTNNANAGNTVLTDLAGYRIYMSTTPADPAATMIAQVSANPTGGGTESYQKDNLAPGTYYFRVTAYDNAGSPNESVATIEVSKTIQ